MFHFNVDVNAWDICTWEMFIRKLMETITKEETQLTAVLLKATASSN